jgi:HD-GYP domain-containing protein (c-di-GMP phosphodiesterase class II)
VNGIFAERNEADERLVTLSSKRDDFEQYSAPHGARIASLVDLVGAAFNLASRDRFFLQQAGLLHDIGEVAMNRQYISAARTLNMDERVDLERHPVIGEQETAKLGLPRGVQLIVRWHHEWWNGGGYPDGLESDQIPLAARILRVVDSYAALTSSRPYRQALSPDEAKKYLAEWSGIEFDPAVVKTFLAMVPQEEMRSTAASASEVRFSIS